VKGALLNEITLLFAYWMETEMEKSAQGMLSKFQKKSLHPIAVLNQRLIVHHRVSTCVIVL
jgi:hypothetical protein